MDLWSSKAHEAQQGYYILFIWTTGKPESSPLDVNLRAYEGRVRLGIKPRELSAEMRSDKSW